MLFHSQQFLLFFPVAWLLYWLLRTQTQRKWCLLISSSIFYASWNPIFLLTIGASAVIDFWLARLIAKSRSEKIRKTLLLASIAISLSFLFYFKYCNFFLDNVIGLLHALGFHSHRPTLAIILPLGISFYTFETISYVVDVYKRTIPAQESLLDYAVFIMFFPHLVAGPIVRARDFLPQLLREKRWSWTNINVGMQLFILGLFKKVVIADRMSAVADPVFQSVSSYNSLTVWMALIAYTIQIYCDFSGYTDMAIGLARMYGYKLSPNFKYPYLSSDLVEFWQRWHISLSSWISDYIYMPLALGGARRSQLKNYLSILVTMTVCGIWHGAGWQFIVWGIYHGVLLAGNYKLRTLRSFAKIKNIIGTPVTLLAFALGLVLFRSPDLNSAMQFFRQMFCFAQGQTVAAFMIFGFLLCLVFSLIEHFVIPYFKGRRLFRFSPSLIAAGSFALLLSVILLAPAQRAQFIYFQF